MSRHTSDSARYELRVDPAEKASWEAAAAAEDLTVAQWARRELHRAAAKRAKTLASQAGGQNRRR